MVLASTTGDIIGAVGTVIAAALGLWGAYIAANSVRNKTVEGQVQAEPSDLVPAGPETPGGSRLSREVEGYVVRFIIFFLVIQLWSAILSVTTPFSAIRDLGGDLVGITASVIYALIFLLLGLPLLVDIYRRYGIRGRPRLRRR